MINSEIIKKLHEFLISNSENVDFQSIDTDTSLIEAGILDSLLMVMIVTFCEEEFQLEIDPEEITEENFESLESIADFLSRCHPIQDT